MSELSPAAAAIVEAFDECYELLSPMEGNWQELCLAAALTAIAAPSKRDALRYAKNRWPGATVEVA